MEEVKIMIENVSKKEKKKNMQPSTKMIAEGDPF